MLSESSDLQDSELWQHIDAVLVINLDGDTERYEALMQRLTRLVPPQKIHRIAAVRGMELPGYGQKPWFTERTTPRMRVCAGAAGCTLSHAKALRYALEHPDWNTVLVLEDDALPRTELWHQHAAELVDFLQHNDTWELCYPGMNENPSYAVKTVWQHIERCSGVLGTCAMLIHRRAWVRFAEHLPTEDTVWSWLAQYKAIDYWLKFWVAPFGEVYSLNPMWVEHPYENVSTISGGKAILPKFKNTRLLGQSAWNRRRVMSFIFTRLALQWDRSCRYVRARLLGFSGGKRAKASKP